MAESSFFPIEMRNTDRFAFDLGHLLDAPAGKRGFMEARDDGHFYFEDGTRARFWGTNLAHDRAAFGTHELSDAVADKLASVGCNMIRFHALDWPTTPGADEETFLAGPIFDERYEDTRHLSEAKLERLDYMIHALRQRGIYIYMDLLDYRQFTAADGVLAAEGLNWAAKPACLYNPHLIELQKEYATQLLTHYNTYTGLRYMDDPAICAVEITNENSLFWEQALHLPQPYVDELQKLWNEWLLEQYGTRQGLSEAWTNHQGRGALMADEDPAAGSVRLPNVVEAFRLDWAHRSYGDPLQGTARCNDGARFYYELMRRYYRQMRDHLRSIGVKVPITSCVTPHIAPDLKAVADELDFISNGTYYDHPNLSVRKIQGSNPYGLAFNTVELHNVRGAAANVALGKVAGKPVIAREWNMPFPSEYRSEAMLQMAAYACLQDWDGLLFYGIGGGVLSFRNELQSFTCYTDPEHWCQFAVAALLFHRRDVQVAQSVLDVGYSHTDTFYAWRSHERVPTRYAAYVTRTQKAFFNRTYAGDADLVVSSGASAQGGYAQARRAFLWAENPAADLHDHVTGRAHVADDLEPAVRSELALVPELHLTHGFGTRLFTVENLGFDSLAMYATRDPAFRVDSLPQGAREIGSDGVHCLGYLHDGKLVLPHLTALDERMRDPQQHTLGRFLLDALNVLGITDKVSRRDLDKGVLRSVTGELARDLCRGVFTVDTPRTQAVVGLIGGSLFKLTDLTIELADQHGVVAATSLDDEPIATAKELLLTVLGRAMNTDQHREGSFVHLGRAPVLYRPAQGTLWLSGDWANAEAKITVCDPNGQPLGQIRATRDERGLKVPLGYAGPAVYYHIVRR